MKRQILLGLSALMIVGAAFAEVSSGEGDGKAAACAKAKRSVPSSATVTSSCYCDEPKERKDYLGNKMDGEWVCYVDYEYKN
ncbi:hypothetical protein R4611_11375 [Acinetobacter baumannii]|uniref:hypothetical protein n=1 Tax=Acinetobacter baumannii TaxID=470 RepID=UPI00112AEB2E|nr:hypothetical protein [Acinetobacter baumannii]MDC4400074.1 hypothetical protein [Acinetobacter baumannii]MDC5301051.1 hypothetical protein [Acinetobacter baumannii]MDV7640488.1 hypothetical protein [Acinetobacter baumannii]TPT05457.1 hypothetical protein FJU77_08220 [Acinetobacter baumannii]